MWRKINIDEMHKDRRLIGSKWAFKKKRNGVYRARMVGLGYSQILGIYHKDFLSGGD